MARYEHDCANCIPLGEFEEYDLYFCDQGGVAPTVIARYGPYGDYHSGLYFGTTLPFIREAIRRAQDKGLLPV